MPLCGGITTVVASGKGLDNEWEVKRYRMDKDGEGPGRHYH